MSKKDYQAISKIIEEVVGGDTITGVKLLEGIKFYFDNKVAKIKIINESRPTLKADNYKTVNVFSEEANKAMQKYTKGIEKDIKKLKASGKYCGIGE